jgi:MOSC domain-containing protein YiiM
MSEVVAVARRRDHRFSKTVVPRIRLLAGLGVLGDAHLGVTVKHRSRVAVDPSQPNLRQVHLIHEELITELRAAGFHVAPGVMGENVTTRGTPLLDLPTGTRLRLGLEAVVELTGLRNPCAQLEAFQPGLLAAVLGRGPNGEVVRRCGVMAVVIVGGVVHPGDRIQMDLPSPPFKTLERV